jgi:hypothetical protein
LQNALNTAQEGLAALETRASKVSWFGRVVSKKHQRILDEYISASRTLYDVRTRIEATEFGRLYIGALVTAFEEMQADVDGCAGLLTSANEDVEKLLNARIREDGEADLKNSVVRYYDPGIVREVAHALEINEARQKAQTTACRIKLIDKMGANENLRTFRSFRDRISTEILRDTIDEHCESAAKEAHDAEVERRKRVLGVSIIQELRDDFGADRERLNQHIAGLVQSAGRFLEFDKQEETLSGPGINGERPSSAFTVFLPEAPDHKEFRESLEQAFRHASTEPVTILGTTERRNEIAIVNIANLFPLRMVKLLKFLRQRYDQRISKQDADRAVLEIHTDDLALRLPSVYCPSLDEIAKEARPFLLLADAMNLIREETNPQTGIQECVLYTTREDGRPRTHVLGRSLADALSQIDFENAAVLSNEVRRYIEKPDYDHLEARQQLKEPILRRLQGVLSSVRNNPRDSFYLAVDRAADVALEALTSRRI